MNHDKPDHTRDQIESLIAEVDTLRKERDKEKWSAIEWHRRHDEAIDARDTTIKELRQQLAMCDSDRTSLEIALEIALECARASLAQRDAEIGTLNQRLETCYGAISIHERRGEGLREEIRRMDTSLGHAFDEIDQRTEESRAWKTAIKTLAERFQALADTEQDGSIQWLRTQWAAREAETAIQAIDPDYKLPNTGNKETTCQE